jgi:hypothetical protein
MGATVDRALVLDGAAFSGAVVDQSLKTRLVDLIERDVQKGHKTGSQVGGRPRDTGGRGTSVPVARA